MRTSGREKTRKKSYKHQQINKKKRYKNKSKPNWDWSDDVSHLFLDNINDVIRQNKTRRAEGRGCWKVMPRDSCEVYKDRRRRVDTRRKFKDDRMSDDTSFYTESQMDEDDVDRRKPMRKTGGAKKRAQPKKIHSKSKHKRRSSYTTTLSSCYTSTSMTTTASEM